MRTQFYSLKLKKNKMQITLTQEESEQFFLSALCNLDYVCGGYNITFVYDFDHYNKVKKPGDCFEDVLMTILRDGGALGLYDNESNELNKIYIKDVHHGVQKMPAQRIINFAAETGDAEDDDVLIQTVFYGEVIFG